MFRLAPLAALLVAWLAPVPALAEPFTFGVTPDSLRADGQGMWSLRLRLQNHGDFGLYPDSLLVDWVRDEPAANGTPHAGTIQMSMLANAMLPASAHDETGCMINMPAEVERGRLTVRFYFHDAHKTAFAAQQAVVVLGSDLDDRYPSLSLEAGGRSAELVVVRADSSAWPAPGVLMLPGSGIGARSLLKRQLALRERGYSVALLSPPGAGASQGPDDRAGPASVAAVHAVLARLGKDPAFDARRIVLWGEDMGATTALLAAAKEPALAGVIAVNARFDPWADYRALGPEDRERFVKAAGRDSSGWRARSPLAAADRIGMPVLVVHTEAGGPADAALAFASRRAERKLSTEARIHGHEAHPLHRGDAVRLATDFLIRRTRSTGP